MIEQLPQRPTLMRPSRLRPINRIKRLIQKQSNCPTRIHPRRHILIKRGIIPKQGQEVEDDEGEAGKGDGIGCHGHGEAFYDDVVVEGLEDVFGGEGVVDAGVLVAVEAFEVFLADVDHVEGGGSTG